MMEASVEPAPRSDRQRSGVPGVVSAPRDGGFSLSAADLHVDDKLLLNFTNPIIAICERSEDFTIEAMPTACSGEELSPADRR